MSKLKQVPQVIQADWLLRDWPQCSRMESQRAGWVLARPLSTGGLWQRCKLAIGVFRGKYDALQWSDSQ